jgi:hypothetical protein
MDEIASESPETTVLIGMGNMVGIGREMVSLWNRVGKSS